MANSRQVAQENGRCWVQAQIAYYWKIYWRGNGLYRITKSKFDKCAAESLRAAIARINPRLPQTAQAEVLQNVFAPYSLEPIQANEKYQDWLTNDREAEHTVNNENCGEQCFLIDFEYPANKDFLVVNQFTVTENKQNKRPDIILFANGIPLVVIELKNPADKNATVHKAFTQLQNYMDATPILYIITRWWLRLMAWSVNAEQCPLVTAASWHENKRRM